MREIKFRAWDEENNFFLRFEIPPRNEVHVFFNIDALNYLNRNKDNIEQFTGLYDKNGTEIYEGDIINGINGKNYQIIFSYGGFQVNDPTCCEICRRGNGTHGTLHEYLATTDKHIEVLGNIHENSELLE